MIKKGIIFAVALSVLGGAYYFFSTPQVKATEFNLDIKETAWEMQDPVKVIPNPDTARYVK